MKICSLASGSSGNCIYIGNEDTNLLIDVGISGKKVRLGLEEIGVDPSTLNGILITHEHSDHIKGIGVIARKYKIPMYTNQQTFKTVLGNKSVGIIDEALYKEVNENQSFMIGSIKVTPFSSSHDAIDPLCYIFNHKDKKISVATDLGTYNDYTKSFLANSNVLFIEANHDVRMLEVGPYPYYLKQRILGDLGHLSNELSAKLVCEIYHEALSHIILGHLSHENNMPDIAYETVKAEMLSRLEITDDQLNIIVAKRNSNTELISI